MSIKNLSYFVSLIIVVAFFAAGCSSGKSYINTSVGEMTVKRAEIVDEFGGRTAKPGFKILLIFFESKDGETKGGFNEAANDVFLTTSFGNRIDRFVGGIVRQETFLGFVIPESAINLMLSWPENDLIPLEI